MEESRMRQATADEYLRHHYEIPAELPLMPLPDEPFTALWQEAEGRGVLDFLADGLGLPAFEFRWQQERSLGISFARTLGGRLPVIATGSHEDFRSMEALLCGRTEARELPLTINAFAMQARAEKIFRHRVLLLNHAPYSNLPAGVLGLSREEWLERSYLLRLAHECAHYETLRLFGEMRNHALDEILADAMGQIVAFGEFDADRQRLFFGLEKGKGICTGRLLFYVQKVMLEEREKVFHAVDRILDLVADELCEMRMRKAGELEILVALARRSIAERI